MWDDAEKFLSKDKYIAPLIGKYGHCDIRPRKHKDYFLSIIREIVGQQLSGRVAEVIFKRFKSKFKGIITPDKVLFLPSEELRNCGMSWGKASYIKDLAQKVKNGNLKTKKLNNMSDEEVIKELIAVKGIGRWTADMFLMFTLGREDIFPTGDLGIKKGMEMITGKKIDGDKLVKFSLRWKPHRTIASFYLWKCLEN